MKAIVVRQPWATLIAQGIKTIETRPAPPNGPMRPDGVRCLPGLPLERGERIAIVAGKPRPKAVGPYDVRRSVSTAYWLDLGAVEVGVSVQAFARQEVFLPLGAVVCTVTVDDALPIVSFDDVLGLTGEGLWLTDSTGGFGDPPLAGEGPRLFSRHRTSDGRLMAQSFTHVADQWPLGDYKCGRWGLMLSDPQPCDPIPCKGKQGVFALPDDVAAVLP